MGGWSSGISGGKSLTSEMRAFDVRMVHRSGGLRAGVTFTWTWSRNGQVTGKIDATAHDDRVMLNYQVREHGEEWRPMAYPIRLEWTPCTYGGRRTWWLCPAVGCGRRVAVLYGGKVFACRHCYKLAYRTQREHPYDRAGSRADKLRERLEWEPGILNAKGSKPKGMHWRTFNRLEADHDELVNQSLAGVMAKFGPLREFIVP